MPELDKRGLDLHRLAVEKIRRDPVLFETVKATLARWRIIVSANTQPYLAEWEQLIADGMETCLAMAVEDSEHATVLRKSSPFAGVLTDEERLAFLKAWEKDE